MEKIELLAKYLEIDVDQIEECRYDSNSFTVNPHTKKYGDNPEQKLAKVNLVKQALDQSGISKVITLGAYDFTPNLYTPISKLFYKHCEELTKIGIHDLVNTLYFLCGGSKGQEFNKNANNADNIRYANEYRDLFAGKGIVDSRKDCQVSDGQYLVLDDSEADERFKEYCQNYIDDCLGIPEGMRDFFDEEKYIDYVLTYDGRGSSLASYDGAENDIVDPDTNETFYIYRTN